MAVGSRDYVDVLLRALLHEVSLAKAGGKRKTLEEIFATRPGGAPIEEAPVQPGGQMTLGEGDT